MRIEPKLKDAHTLALPGVTIRYMCRTNSLEFFVDSLALAG